MRNARFRRTIRIAGHSTRRCPIVHTSHSFLAAFEHRPLGGPQLEREAETLTARVTHWNHKLSKIYFPLFTQGPCRQVAVVPISRCGYFNNEASQRPGFHELRWAQAERGAQFPVGSAARSYVPFPAVSFPGGFRTPAVGGRGFLSHDRHPKPFTQAEELLVSSDTRN
jgi:hypothetical protein